MKSSAKVSASGIAMVDDADRVRDELARSVEAFNVSLDPVERTDFIVEIRKLRAQLKDEAAK